MIRKGIDKFLQFVVSMSTEITTQLLKLKLMTKMGKLILIKKCRIIIAAQITENVRLFVKKHIIYLTQITGPQKSYRKMKSYTKIFVKKQILNTLSSATNDTINPLKLRKFGTVLKYAPYSNME